MCMDLYEVCMVADARANNSLHKLSKAYKSHAACRDSVSLVSTSAALACTCTHMHAHAWTCTHMQPHASTCRAYPCICMNGKALQGQAGTCSEGPPLPAHAWGLSPPNDHCTFLEPLEHKHTQADNIAAVAVHGRAWPCLPNTTSQSRFSMVFPLANGSGLTLWLTMANSLHQSAPYIAIPNPTKHSAHP